MKKLTFIILAVINCIAVATNAADTSPAQAPSRSNNTAATPTSATTAEAKFVARATSSGMAEVQMGQIAQQKGSQPKVKEMAQMLIDDHTKANQELAVIAGKGGILLPANLNEDHAKMGEKLMNAEAGKEFDKDFAKAMVKSHQMTIEEFEAAQKEVTDPAVLNYIQKTLPTLRAHLEHAKHLEESL